MREVRANLLRATAVHNPAYAHTAPRGFGKHLNAVEFRFNV